MGDPTRSSLPDTAVTACPHPSWELRWEATTSTRTIRTRPLSLCLTLVCTRTTTAGTSTTTFACSPLRGQSAWDPTLQQLACPPAWKSTPRAPPALSPDGEPPLRAVALPVSSRRWTSLLCPTTIAVTPTARPPAREILAVHSCAATSSPELSLGDTGAPRLATQECTHNRGGCRSRLGHSCSRCEPDPQPFPRSR